MSARNPSKVHLLLLCQVVVLFLSGCNNLHPRPDQVALQEIDAGAELLQALLTTENFGIKPTIENQHDIHLLPEAIANDFLAFMAAPRNAHVKANMRMYHYLEKYLADFVYEGQTFTAAKTATLNAGNCMSLAVFTTALADLAGLEIDYQLMDDVPVYEFNNSLIKKGLHIRSSIYEPEKSSDGRSSAAGISGLFRAKIVIDYFPTKRQRFITNIDRDDYMAMYFQNLAVESLDKAQLDSAYWYAMEALAYVSDNANALNTLAIINRHAGHPETAEQIYRYGIEQADDKLSLLKNYALLLSASGRLAEAQVIQAQIDLQDDPSPYHWFELAKTTFDNGEYRQAIGYFRRALSIAPYLHEAHLGIAQANYALGRFKDSRTALQAAIEEADRVSTRNLYRAKMLSLTSVSKL